jgi:hypothetical protein
MTLSFEKIKDVSLTIIGLMALAWVTIVFMFQTYMLILYVNGNEPELSRINKEFLIRLHGGYSHDPKNVFYKEK